MLTNRQKKKILQLLFAAIFMIFILSVIAISERISLARIYFFDVGQGSSSLIRLPDETDILIDGGPNNRVLEELGRAMPFWDRKIEYLIVTHPDLDHYFGMIAVFDAYNVETIILNGLEREGQNYRQFAEAVKAERARVIIPDPSLEIDLRHGKSVKIINNYKLFGEESKDTNGSALIVKYVDRDFQTLFPGDIEAVHELRAINAGLDLSADILLSPHHGSKTSSTEKFLAAVNPKMIIISCGLKNKYGHPHRGTLERYQSLGIAYLRTDREGAIVLESDGNSYWRK